MMVVQFDYGCRLCKIHFVQSNQLAAIHVNNVTGHNLYMLNISVISMKYQYYTCQYIT